MEVVKVFLFDKDNEVQYGLNWGQRDGREPNQAYLQLTPEVYRSDFFPVKKHYFLVDTDDGFSFVMNRGQKGEDGSALETPEDNSLLGKYLRKRLGVPENSRIEKSAIEAYGRSDIDFVKIGMNHYKMDFSLNHSFVSSEVINQSRNRIIFGAPGTGKSNKLKFESEIFINQKSEKIDSFLTHLLKCKTYGDFIKLGILHSDELKKLTVTQISQKYNVKQAYWIKKGAAYNIGEILSDEELPEEIGERLKSIPHGKQESEGMEVGYKYCNFFEGKSKEYLIDQYEIKPVVADWIIYGAEAGMSTIEKESEVLKFLERVTFHPNYSYAQFVGTYKPVQDSADENQIKYEYIPGPFMRIYMAAKQNPSQNFLLLIEEINRANVAAVFGDVFQLLDRDKNDNSEYPVAASEDIKKYLAKNGIHEDELKIPSNMYIWATMNSADQGVFPMDTAFKRRWEFEYIDINKNADKLVDEDNKPILIPIPSKEGKIAYKEIKYDLYKWNDVREKINEKLSEISSVSEDKLLGPFFINLEKLRSAKNEPQEFIKLFKSKVLMYLFEDVVKISPTKLFEKCGDHPRYSKICSKFDEIGCGIFGFELESLNPSETEPSETANE